MIRPTASSRAPSRKQGHWLALLGGPLDNRLVNYHGYPRVIVVGDGEGYHDYRRDDGDRNTYRYVERQP